MNEDKLAMFHFWFDKSVPYCCRDCVPLRYQHKDQLYEYEMHGKVEREACPKYNKK